MSKIVSKIIDVCLQCPFRCTEQDESTTMLTVFCMHEDNFEILIFSDENGDSWKVHKEIHSSCPLPDSD